MYKTCADPEGDWASETPSWKFAITSLEILVQTPWKITKLPRQNSKLGHHRPTIETHLNLSHGMGFPKMWYVRLAKPQISLRIRAV